MEILTINARYLPGYKAGGPIRSLASIVDRLSDEFRFKIIASDRDSGDTQPYAGIQIDAWQPVGSAEVYYLSPRGASLRGLGQVMRATRCEVVYLNSFFCPAFTVAPLLLRWLGAIPNVPFIVAPRGEFSPGALAIKARKKRAYLAAAKGMGLYNGVLWHASSEYEEADIRRHFGSGAQIVVAPNLSAPPFDAEAVAARREKAPGSLRAMFLSRVARKKNLDGALRMLDGLDGEVEFDIFGPREDFDYWQECEGIVGKLPPNIRVRYQGAVEHSHVGAVMRNYDLFFLPTWGENFGHVILEAFLNGCLVLISDQTPWRGLEEQRVGWDLPLDQPERFREALQHCLDMDAAEHRTWSRLATEHGRRFCENGEVVRQNRALFQQAGRLAAAQSERPLAWR